MRTIMLLLVAAALCGCQTPQQSMSKRFGLSMNETELAEYVEELRNLFIGEFDHAADNVLAATNDPELRRRALLAKIRINQTVHTASSHTDPAVALIDMWALSGQIRDNLQNDSNFGEYTPGLLRASDSVHEGIIAVARRLSAERFDSTEAVVEEYVAENPLRGNMYRPSPTPLLAEYRRRTGGGLFGVKSVEASVDDISERLDVMTKQLPKQILWRTDLLIETRLQELFASDRVSSLLDMAETLPDQIERMRLDTLDDVDRQRLETIDAVARERDATIDEIEAMRVDILQHVDELAAASLDDVERQRLDTLQQIDGMLAATLDTVDEQRTDVLDRVDQAVAVVLDDVTHQREAATLEIRQITNDAVSETDDIVTRAIDRIFIRLLALVGVGAIGLIIAAAIWRTRA